MAQVLLADPATDLLPRVRFLIEEVGIDQGDIPRVIEAFPVIFGVSMEQQMIPTLRFIRDLGIPDTDVVKVRTSARVRCYQWRSSGQRFGLTSLPSRLLACMACTHALVQICRAFPSLLGLEVDRHLAPSISFLRCVGHSFARLLVLMCATRSRQ